MATTVSLTEFAGLTLKQKLARAERINRLKAQGLILPLLVFLFVVFLLPIGVLLYKSVENPEVVGSLPRTVEAISTWDGRGLPDEPVYRALALDLADARKNQTIGDLSKRLNMELAGYRSLLAKTGRALPFKQEPASFKDALENLDERWGDPAYWQVIRRNDSGVTSYFLLASLDHRIDDLGELASATPDQAIYLDIFARTFWMGLVITAICLVLAYPLAYLLANLPTRTSNLLMILVLLPFWTSILVRVAAWIVLLQSGGLINSALMALGIIGATVMPHNLYLHSGIVQTRAFGMDLPAKREALRLATWDSTIALMFALTINASILILAAAAFYTVGENDVAEIDKAHLLLEPLLGSSLAPVLFGVALLCAGLNSTVTATMAGQIVMEGFIRLRIAPWAAGFSNSSRMKWSSASAGPMT